MEKPSNPFHPQAVVTYGSPIVTYENLLYMDTVLNEMNNYLINYASKDSGKAVGIKGAHGSGKTHILSWLAQKAASLETSDPTILYAKADSTKFFALYKQYTSNENLRRESLEDLIWISLRKRAKNHLERAKVTEELSDEIDSEENYQKLIKEGEIDPEELMGSLQKLLVDSKVPDEIISVLLQLINPELGSIVFNWISGRDLDKESLSDLGVEYNLREISTNNETETETDYIAINALETLAALHQVAEKPLIIFLDQFEVLMNSQGNPSRLESLNSLIKKFIENLSRQKTLLIIAGNHLSWDNLRRDVTPRLHNREPILVGNLDSKETKALINSYTKNTDRFSKESIKDIHRLSGGIPREVIRICYYAYEQVKGILKNTDQDILIESSKKSGPIDDQLNLLLNQADAVLKKYGQVINEVSAGDNSTIDRVVNINGKNQLALVVLKATDKISEVDSAEKVKEINKFIEVGI